MDLVTQNNYDLYEVASALQKSIRRGDTKTAGFFALELFPRYAEYCWRRLLTISAEDCYGIITKEIKALYDSFWVINKNNKGDNLKGRIFISKAVILLSEAKHNRDADLLSNYIYDKRIGLDDDVINNYFDEVRKENIKMPEYVYDVHTIKGKKRGKTKRDFFIEEEKSLANKQMSIFDLEL